MYEITVIDFKHPKISKELHYHQKHSFGDILRESDAN